jgi:hypothetical protein
MILFCRYAWARFWLSSPLVTRLDAVQRADRAKTPSSQLRIFQKTNVSRSYDSKLRPPNLPRFWRWRFKDDTSNIVLAPDRFADVNRSEVVQAKFEIIRQLLGFKSKLDTNTKAGEIVNSAMVNCRPVNQDPCRVISLGALRSPVFPQLIFHLMVRLLRVRCQSLVNSLPQQLVDANKTLLEIR